MTLKYDNLLFRFKLILFGLHSDDSQGIFVVQRCQYLDDVRLNSCKSTQHNMSYQISLTCVPRLSEDYFSEMYTIYSSDFFHARTNVHKRAHTCLCSNVKS